MDIKGKIKGLVKKMYQIHKERLLYPIPHPVNYRKLLEGKTVLVTGGNSGVGYAIAKVCCDHGAQVIIAGRNEDKLKSCCNYSDNMQYVVLDVRKINTFSEKVKEVASMFDRNKIDILVNSAGLVNKADFFNMTEEEYDAIMETNLKGTYFMSQAVAKHMMDNDVKGHILNVSSSSALRPAWTPYQLSKWAIKGLTRGLADILLPYGIIVNAIAPGPTATPMLSKTGEYNESIDCYGQPSGRYAMPSEIAHLAVFMISDMGNLIVGDTFYITGGSGVISLKH